MANALHGERVVVQVLLKVQLLLLDFIIVLFLQIMCLITVSKRVAESKVSTGCFNQCWR